MFTRLFPLTNAALLLTPLTPLCVAGTVEISSSAVTFDSSSSDSVAVDKAWLNSVLTRLAALEAKPSGLSASNGPPGNCDGSRIGQLYYDTNEAAYKYCPGSGSWKLLISTLGTQNNPAKSCKDLKVKEPGFQTGVYWIEPNNQPAFQVYCDQTAGGGGWTKILHYTGAAYPINTGAVGDTAVAGAATAFAKLSDAQINSIGGTGVKEYFFQAPAPQTKNFWVKTPHTWKDNVIGNNLVKTTTGVSGCLSTSYGTCTFKAHNGYTGGAGVPILDTHTWINNNNDCTRWFSDHLGIGCYNPRSSGSTRCFSSGSSCGSHYRIDNVQYFVREV